MCWSCSAAGGRMNGAEGTQQIFVLLSNYQKNFAWFQFWVCDLFSHRIAGFLDSFKLKKIMLSVENNLIILLFSTDRAIFNGYGYFQQPIQNNMWFHRYFKKACYFQEIRLFQITPITLSVENSDFFFHRKSSFHFKSSNKNLQKINEFICLVLQIHLETRLPALWFWGVEIKQNVFDASNLNVHFKNENISANIPCQNNPECFRWACFAVPIKTARPESWFLDENKFVAVTQHWIPSTPIGWCHGCLLAVNSEINGIWWAHAILLLSRNGVISERTSNDWLNSYFYSSHTIPCCFNRNYWSWMLLSQA